MFTASLKFNDKPCPEGERQRTSTINQTKAERRSWARLESGSRGSSGRVPIPLSASCLFSPA